MDGSLLCGCVESSLMVNSSNFLFDLSSSGRFSSTGRKVSGRIRCIINPISCAVEYSRRSVVDALLDTMDDIYGQC